MLSQKQKRLISFGHREGTICLSVGVIRSGKTWASVFGFMLYTQTLDKPYTHLVLGRKSRVIELEILSTMKIVAEMLQVKYNYIGYKYTVEIGNQTYIIAAGQDELSTDRIQGITAHSALIDEGTLLPEKFFNTALSRLTFSDSKCWVTCNPSYPLHYLKTKWLDAGQCAEDYQFEFTDNPILTKETVDRYYNTFSGMFAKRMVEGLWCAAEGLIWPTFTQEADKRKPLRTDLGIDYGPASTTAISIFASYKGDEYSVLDSVGIKGGSNRVNKTDRELADIIVDIAKKYKCGAAYLDPAASSLRTELLQRKDRGFSCRKADNNVLPGIQVIGSALTHGDLTVHPRCTSLITELDSYSWDPDKEDTILKVNDHHCDALRYVGMAKIRRVSEAVSLPDGF